MSLVLVTAPAVEPVSVAEARAMLNISSAVMSDVVLGAFVSASREMIDGSIGWVNRCLITQTWDLILDAFPWQDYYSLLDRGFYPRPYYPQPSTLRLHQREGIIIPLAPVQSIVSITYQDSNGDPQSVDPSAYVFLQGSPARLVQSFAGSWPAASLVPGSVKVRFVAGYGDIGSAVPQPFRAAIALQASHLRSLAARNLFISSETVTGVGAKTYVVGNGAGNAIDATVQALLEPFRMILQ